MTISMQFQLLDLLQGARGNSIKVAGVPAPDEHEERRRLSSICHGFALRAVDV